MMLTAAFAQPVDDAQATFRTLLSALSEPLLPRALPVFPDAPAGVSPAAAALLLTLADADTAVWLPDGLADAAAWLRFHAGCVLVSDIAVADFVYLPQRSALPDLPTLKRGSADYPDRSATLIVDVAGFDRAAGVTGSGPGFAAPRRLGIQGLAGDFWPQWTRANCAFPLGIDAFFVARDAVVGLPRTTRLEL
ncbi:alpha-D-ribose 1-methylphosphonate 5-triphosphate synthase subunit PhnH [Crenobacter luteus]|uniref:phosphonate C-P lyase system protein PhnH n=1 Tax=Crenobacter luteus TaxID=1452487 RepID=UPI00104E246F|nr:phosphonate C-P lyase system protein PhnH [Crenobacter luteus]TCP15546.1 alpha-D-ribose 1-methylphosphonate 5-triphosphate synthase subunit PhnH [Crenobacter luteus]